MKFGRIVAPVAAIAAVGLSTTGFALASNSATRPWACARYGINVPVVNWQGLAACPAGNYPVALPTGARGAPGRAEPGIPPRVIDYVNRSAGVVTGTETCTLANPASSYAYVPAQYDCQSP